MLNKPKKKMKELLIDNEIAKIEHDNGVIVATWKAESVTLGSAKDSVKIRLQYTGEKPYLLLADTTAVKKISKEARTYLGSKEGCERVKHCAIVVNSSLGAMIVNFFMRINKPLVPTKLFSEKSAAHKWLTAIK